MAAQSSLSGVAKTQSFGGRIQRSSRRLPESMARVLAHVFAGAEADAGLKSISYGQTDGTVSAKGDAGSDLWSGLFDGSENDDGFVHLFAAERYVLGVQRQGAKASRVYNEALAAIKAMSITQVGRVHVAILFAHYGPVRPDVMDRGVDSRWGRFGEVCTVVEHTPTVLARRASMARKLGDERVEAAELAAVSAFEAGGAAYQTLVTAEQDARGNLDRARDLAKRNDDLAFVAREALAKEQAWTGEPRTVRAEKCDCGDAPSHPVLRRLKVTVLAEEVERRVALETMRVAAIARHEGLVSEARNKRLGFLAECSKQGPERTARPAREIAVAAIREGANREVSAAAALADILRNAKVSVQKLSAVKVRIKVEGDQVLTQAEDAYRDALSGETK